LFHLKKYQAILDSLIVFAPDEWLERWVILTPKTNENEKILLGEYIVKGKIAYGNSLSFQVQIADLRLKCCILVDELKNKSTGRKCGVFGQYL